MRLSSRSLASSAVLLTALLASCDSPTRPQTEGSISPRIEMVRADPELFRVNFAFDSVFARVYSGGAPVGGIVELNAGAAGWSGTVDDLTPGPYDIEVLGYARDSLQHWGRSNGINVVAGARAQPSLTFTPLAPNLPSPAATTFEFTATITFPTSIAGATGYRAEASKSNSFTSPITAVETVGLTATTIIMQLPDTGTWYYRAKPLLPSNNQFVRYSDHRSFQLLPAPAGRTPGTANTFALTIGPAGGMVPSRNITATGPDTVDYFTLPDLRAGDSLLVEAVAAALTPPSPLDPQILLLRQNQIDTVGLDLDGGVSSDARLFVAIPANETYYVIVSGDYGHYEFRYVVRRNPAMPTGLTATVAGPGSVQLDWTDNAGVNSDPDDGYEVFRCAGAGCTPPAPPAAPLATTAADATTYTDNTAAVGQEYSYRIRARQDADHFSPLTPTVSVSLIVPLDPSALTATTISDTQVDLAWSDNASTETGYEVQRCIGAGCVDFTELVTLGADAGAHSDLTAEYGFVYRYQVRALSAQGSSGFSNVVDGSTEPPATPTVLTALATSPTAIALGWVDNAGDETGFRVERCETAGCTDFIEIATTAANLAVYLDEGLTPDTDYRYRVRAYHVVLSQTYSNVADGDTRPAAAPSDLVATVGVGQVTLSWTDNADDETAIEVERCAGGGCAFLPLESLAPGSVGYIDAAVSPNQNYAYRVRAVSPAGNSAFSAEVGVLTTIHSAPSGLTATTVSGTQIDLAWTDNANGETGYVIERCAGDACGSFAFLAAVAADAEAFSDMTAVVGESYSYQVLAAAAFGNSVPSSTATTTTRVPAAPTSLVATTLSNSSIELTWADNALTETGLRVERCTGPACEDFTEVTTLGVDAVGFTDTGLGSNAEYSYRVSAVNVVGFSDFSNVATATTNLPAIPTSFAAGVLNLTDIRLTWTDNSTDEIDQRLERCTLAGCSDFVEIATIGADVSLYDDPGLVDGTVYQYRLRARNGAGYSDYSEVASITAGLPATPSGLSATTASASQIDLSWTDNSDNEAAFVVYRCVGAGCVDWAPHAVLPAGVSSYEDTGVALGNIYRYRVLSQNGAGDSPAPSNEVEANTMPADAPVGLVATTISSVRIDLAWSDGGTFETGYEVERCTGDGCSDFAPLLTTGADVEAFEDAGLASGLTYGYRVRAVNGVGPSAYAGPVYASTNLPADPSSLMAVAASASSVELTWSDNATNETDYIVERCTGVGCGSFAVLTLLASNVENYTDGTVAYGETYRYRVQAVGSAGASQFTPIASVTVIEPIAPTDFTATTTSGTSITLAWTDAPNNEVDFRIVRCTGVGCSSFVEIGTVPPNSTGFVDNTAALNESYTYMVHARNAVGDSPFTSEATANTFLPADPTDLVAMTISAERIDLVWTDVATNEGGYRIERCAGPGCSDFALLVDVAANEIGHQDTGLDAEQSYTYRLTAFNVAGNSATIGPVSATTMLPAAPSDLAALVTSSSAIDLTWTDNAGNESGYRIERCTGTGCSDFVEIDAVGPDETSYTSTGLAGNSFYTHRVRAFNAAGTSAYTPNVVSNTFAPGAPSALSATTLTATSVSLTWNDNSGNEAGFRIERCSGGGCSGFAEIGTVGVDVETFVDLAAPAGVPVSYRVRSYNGVGTSTYSATASANTTVPATPSALVATAQGQGAIALTWTDNATDESSYEVERCTGVGCTDFAPLTSLAANSTLYTDPTVAASTAYRYRVAAAGNGVSDFSNVADATTIVPDDPSGLIAVAVSDDRVDLTWIDNSDNEILFRIFRCSGVDCVDFAELTTVGAGVVAYSDLSVTGGGLFRYMVTAVNNAGTSSPTAVAEAETNIPGLPTALTASVVTAVQIDLAWTDNATTETGFSIERCTGASCTDFAEITTVAADVVFLADVTVTPSTTYRYRVRAVNANGASGYTNIATAATNPPDAPTGLAATIISAGQVDLTWTDASNNEASFGIERCSGMGCVDFAQIATVGVDQAAYSDLTVAAGVVYRYQVRAMNAAGASGYTTEDVTVAVLLADAATGLVATTISATRIDLAWTDNANNESAVRVDRCIGSGCADFSQVVELPADAVAYADEGLTAGLLYRYRIVMLNAVGESAPSNEDEASTDFPLPPTALLATTMTATRIDLTWTDNSGNEDNFEIERCDTNGCSDFGPLVTVGTDVFAYSDETVTPGNSYTYRVRATNFAGASDFTNTASATTLPPGDPTILTAVATTPTTVQVTWTAQASTIGYSVERCEAAACTFLEVANVAHPTDLVDDAVTTGVTYRYRVVAYNNAGASNPSAELEVAINPPATITGVTGIALSGTQSFVTWTDNAPDETSVRVERCVGAGCGAFSTIATLPANATEYQDDGLAVAGVYRYRLVAENAVGAGTPSAEVEVSLNAPQAPTSLTAFTSGPGAITLNWVDNSDRELRFAVERCTGVLCVDFVQVAQVSQDITGYLNSGLDLNANYRFRVRALNNVGPSAYTNIALSGTFLPAPASGLAATTVHGERIDLLWADNSNNEGGFRIQRCTGVGCSDFVQVATVGPNVTSSIDNSVTYGNSYSYRVLASNISGDAAPSNVATASTALATPVNVVATTLNRNDIRITWNDIGAFEQAYEIFRCEGPGCSSFTGVGAVGGAINTFTDFGLAGASDFTYQVRAATVGGASNFSAGAGARTPIDVANGTLLSIPADTFQGRRHWVVTIPAGLAEFRVQFNPIGFEDPDLYVRRFAAPTETGPFMSDELCAPYSSGIETCVFVNPPAGDFYIMMHGFSAYSGGTVAVNVQFEFNNCSAVGHLGPGQAQCDAAYAASNLAGDVSVASGIQTFTVPYAGTYQIEAVGAAGRSGSGLFQGGRGAVITGNFNLTAGSTLKLAVGQMGIGQNSLSNAGGGGGSFVVDGADNPMLVAGGGGGVRTDASQNGCNASITQFGGVGVINPTSPCAIKVDALGAGGALPPFQYGSSGAGFFGNGVDDAPMGEGGRSWANGMLGGNGFASCGLAAPGGFGGAGAGNGCYGGGGGGGYSGGDGGWIAGGGGSYNTGTSPTASITPTIAHGRIRIRWIGP